MRTMLFSAARRFDALGTLMLDDIAYAGLSIIFVASFLCVHTKSLFIGSISMLLILLTFPVTGVIFGGIGQISYFHVLQLMVIFIILGIAADDIFVVVDAWNQSILYEELKGKDIMETRVKRMSYTLRRSGFACAVTSVTTFVAFLANVNSELMPIKAFGAFAAIIVLVNYFMFVFYFPAILMFWDQRIRNKAPGCAFEKGINCGTKVLCKRVPEEQETDEVKQVEGAPKPEFKNERSKVDIFFGVTFNNIIAKYKWVFFAIIGGWSLVSCFLAAKLGPLTEEESFLPADHWGEKYLDISMNDFNSGSEDVAIDFYLFWGVKGINKDDID